VIRTAEAYGGGVPSILPDLSIEWKSTPYLMNKVRHPKADLVQARPYYNRSTYHAFNGFVAAAGSSISAGTDLGEVSPLDFAPVCLSLMGIPCPWTPVGRPINRLFDQLWPHKGTTARAS
jgi:predicted AlkP superfamily phosphohydrolase/phosphomutase